MCGEYISFPKITSSPMGPPPQARGIHFSFSFLGYRYRTTPACAGNTDDQYDQMIDQKGTPPHVRGIPVRLFRRLLACRTTPAYAGNTEVPFYCRAWSEDHPRLRGEYTAAILYTVRKTGTPPLARGIHLCSCNDS